MRLINNAYAPNNEVLLMSSVTRHTRQRVFECRGDILAHGDARSRVQIGKRRTWPPRGQVYLDSLPWLAALSSPIWGMRMTRIILCCFGNKRCGMLGHIPLLCHNCRFRVTPSAWKLRIARYRCVAPAHSF